MANLQDDDEDVLGNQYAEELPPEIAQQLMPHSVAGNPYSGVAQAASASKPQPKSIAGPAPTPAPSVTEVPRGTLDTPTAMPATGGPLDMPTASPSVPRPAGPAEQRLTSLTAQGAPPVTPLHGWKKALDIAGQAFTPYLEQDIRYAPQNAYEKNLANAKTDYAAEIEPNKQTLADETTARQNALSGAQETELGARAKNEESESDSRVKAEKTPEIQAYDDYVKQGKTPAEAYRQVMQDQISGKPPTAEADKQWQGVAEQNLAAGTIAPADRSRLAGMQREAKMTGIGPEVVAQVGVPPVPADFQRGSNDPAYKKADMAWGKAAEGVKNQEAGAAGYARGAGYNETRPVQVIVQNKDGSYSSVYEAAGAAEKEGSSTSAAGQKAVSQQAQFNDINSAIKKVGKALDAVGNSGFSPDQTAKLTLAMREQDPTIMHNEIRNLAASGLTDDQQDLVTWLGQLNERAMSLRSIAGMGQGSDSVRNAITAALPSITSGSPKMAHKQLDALQNMVDNLKPGILNPNPKGGNAPAGGGAPPAKAGTAPPKTAAEYLQKLGIQ